MLSFHDLDLLATRMAESQIGPVRSVYNPNIRKSESHRLTQPQLFVIMQFGQEIGFSPYAATENISVYKDRPYLTVQGMNAAIRRAGHRIVKVKSDHTICVLEGYRKDEETPNTVTFTMDDAVRADLPRKNPAWNSYPDAMLYARALSKLARQQFPDCIAGLGYGKDELEEIYGDEPVSKEAQTNKTDNQAIQTAIENELLAIKDISVEFHINSIKALEAEYGPISTLSARSDRDQILNTVRTWHDNAKQRAEAETTEAGPAPAPAPVTTTEPAPSPEPEPERNPTLIPNEPAPAPTPVTTDPEMN